MNKFKGVVICLECNNAVKKEDKTCLLYLKYVNKSPIKTKNLLKISSFPS